jgi:hypothetical protein
VNPETLVAIWSAPDNTRLTSKQYTFRLPTHVAAKLHALGDMYPAKTRTQIVADLLTSALANIEQGMPFHEGEVLATIPGTHEEVREMLGPRVRFCELANKYFDEIERELGNETPTPLYPKS